MIEASFEAVVPKAINAEFEAIIPREKAFDIVNKDINIDTNGKYEVKADAGTAMTQVNVEVEVPNNIVQETIIDSTGKGVRIIKHIIFAEGVTAINSYATTQSQVEFVHLPSTLKRIEERAFHTSQSLSNINTIPKSVEFIGQYAFVYCGKLLNVDFKNHDFVPTLGGAAVFSGQTIIVPDALYDEWIVATNWATYASRIVKASEFVEPTNT